MKKFIPINPLKDLPTLSHNDMVIWHKLRITHSYEFYSNVTPFLLDEMYHYIEDHRVWRISIMGEPRRGKSEFATSLAFLYRKYFNHCMDEGVFDSLDVWGDEFLTFKKSHIDFTTDNVAGNQSDYIYTLRKAVQNKTIRFGQIWQIDEARDKGGGIGSYTEDAEIKNINNICAKFMQSEIWIQPLRFEHKNCPYGVLIYKKDIVNRVNWGLVYKIEMSAHMTAQYSFLGWACLPLHENHEFRKIYNLKKNKWIVQEFTGQQDPRMVERHNVAVLLSSDPIFTELSKSGKDFKLSISQQISILENWIREDKTHNWNEVEKYRIVSEGRMIFSQKAKLPINPLAPIIDSKIAVDSNNDNTLDEDSNDTKSS